MDNLGGLESGALSKRRDMQIGLDLARLRGETDEVHGTLHLLHENGRDMRVLHPGFIPPEHGTIPGVSGSAESGEGHTGQMDTVVPAAGGVAAGQTVEQPSLPPAA